MRFRFSWPVRAASPIAGNLTRLGKVKLNLDCWIFYQEGYVNIDRNEVRADRYEDIFHSASFADEIYAGHVAEHVDDVKASLGRWFKVLKPGGRITITVPDCRGEIECGWNENVFPPWS